MRWEGSDSEECVRRPGVDRAAGGGVVIGRSSGSARARDPAAARPTEGFPEPPVAPRRPERLEAHGHVRVDEYYWLRNRQDPEVQRYLEAENAYLDAVLAHTAELRERLYREIRGRVQETDRSVPYLKDGYWYYTRYEEGLEYPIYCRRRGDMEAPEEVILDANLRARDHAYYAVGERSVSPSGRFLAFAEDTVGRRIHVLRIRDLETGELLPEAIGEVAPSLAWLDDGTLFYARLDRETLRWHRVFRHRPGEEPGGDAEVYREEDTAFWVRVERARSGRGVLISCRQTVTSQVLWLPAETPDGAFRPLLPRERGHEHDVDHLDGHFWIRTNREADNFRLVRAPASDVERWEEVLPERDDALLESFELFARHLVAVERCDAVTRLRVRRHADGAERTLAFDEPAYAARLGDNPEPETDALRFVYSSLTTPNTTYEQHMETGHRTLLKREPVLGGFDPADYATERLHAPAEDGERVPISLVYRRDLYRRDGSAPLLLYGYGSYGLSIDPAFSSARLSLLDRGFAYAIAHVRGGEELGRRWYEAGRLLHKRNTFTDFIACAEHLAAEGYADPERLYAVGGSAGGLLLGTVVNLRPDLFHGLVVHVPFVDLVTTMLDDGIPLTTGEYDEWGDPRRREFYRYLLSYSPYDNVREQAYPHMLVTTGLHDSQVQYWEPAKWVARLRERRTDDRRLLLRTNLKAGHGGASGRYQRYREIALDWAFLLDLAGLADEEPGAG